MAGWGKHAFISTHLSEQIGEEEVRLPMAFIAGVVTLLLLIDPRTLAQVLCPVAAEYHILKARQKHTSTFQCSALRFALLWRSPRHLRAQRRVCYKAPTQPQKVRID